MNIIQTEKDQAQYHFDLSMDADVMNDHYKYQLMPFVDELIDDYQVHLQGMPHTSLRDIPTDKIIELTEYYLKARDCVNYDLLQDLLEDRTRERFHDMMEENNLRLIRDQVNGELSIGRRF